MKKRPKKILNKSKEQPSPLPAQILAVSPFQSLRKILGSWWARTLVVLALVGGITAVIQFYGIYLETLPDVHPNGQSSDASSYTLPFSIKNRSPYFAMSNITLHCEYSIVTWDVQSPKPQDTPYKLFRARGTITTDSKGNDTRIPPGESVNFPCDASEAAQASIAGQKLPVIEVRMRIKMDYHTDVAFASVPRGTSTSPLFIWKKAASGFQWFEGDIIQ